MSVVQKPISVLIAMNYSDMRKRELAVDNLKDCTLIQSIIRFTLSDFGISEHKFMIPENKSRSVDLYVQFKMISNEDIVDDIVKEIKNKTHGCLSRVSAYITS